MTIKQLENYYSRRLHKGVHYKEVAQKLVMSLTIDDIADLIKEDIKSLYYDCPDKDAPPHTQIRFYFIKYLEDYGENIVDPQIKVDANQEQQQ